MQRFHDCFRLVLVLSGLLASGAQAHDFWMEAAPYYSDVDQRVDITLHVGTDFLGNTQPNIYSWYDDFSLYHGAKPAEVDGDLGDDPAGHFSPKATGTYLIGYQSTFTYIEIEPEKFNQYLIDEGLDNAIQFREAHNETQQPARENYIRHAKILIQAGDGFEVDDSLREIGYPLEITPVQNPYQLKVGDELTFGVKFFGHPLHDLLLIAHSKSHPLELQKIRTDEAGQARIKLDRPGPWLIKVVRILRLTDQQAQWQSHWASLTFSVRD